MEILLEYGHDIIYTLDREGNFTFINQKIREWGYREEELLGRPFFSILAESQKIRRSAEGKEKGEIYEVKLKVTI